MEWRHKDIEGKVSAILASTEANIIAMEKVQSMLKKYMHEQMERK